MKRFRMNRMEDALGISGTGIIAEGVVSSTGRVVVFWLTAVRSIVVYDSIEDVKAIMGHGNKTRMEWIDE